MDNDNTLLTSCQEVALSDSVPPSELEELKNIFDGKKSESLSLVAFYRHFFPDDEHRIKRAYDCAQFLEFAHIPLADSMAFSDKGKLYRANFCRERLCSMCNFRRSLKLCSNMFKILDDFDGKYSFISLTLTIPNVNGEDLPKAISKLMKGIQKLFHYRRVKNSVLGYFRSLEMTYNKEKHNYHPHYHFMLAVDKSYFASKKYIKESEWLELWRLAMGDDTISQLDVRRLYYVDSNGIHHTAYSPEDIKKGSLEFTKYSVKSADLVDFDVMYNFYRAFKNRRLVDYQGVFRDALNRLQLADVEDENADLIHIDEDNLDKEDVLLLIRYHFNYEKRAYFEAETSFKSLSDVPKVKLQNMKISFWGKV